MAKTPSFETFRDPAHSLWQSIVHATVLKHAAKGDAQIDVDHRGLGRTSEHPMMSSSTNAIRDLTHVFTPTASTMHGPPHPDEVIRCAKLGAELAWATMFDPEKAVKLRDEFKNSSCDPMWMECFYEYEKFALTGGTQPYLHWKKIDDFVIEGRLPDKAKVAIIGDWGTGMNEALVLLHQIADNFQPDVLIHLGDIYYSGLPSECKSHFTDLIDEVWPEKKKRPLVYVLDGNHDRYAGSNGGYYPMITKLNADKKFMQPNSYFCLRNNFWQFVAMDTGYHDTNPWTEYRNITSLEEREAEWCRDKIRRNGDGVDPRANATGARGTVLLSHHQLMSTIGVGEDRNNKTRAVNPLLAEAFEPVFDAIDFWLWGHEHDLCIFKPYTADSGIPLPTGRCVGASAVPVLVPESPGTATLTLPPSETKAPQVEKGTRLGDNGEIYNHAYAMMTLDGSALTIDYYQLDSTGGSVKSPPPLRKIRYSDRVTGPKAAGGKPVRSWFGKLFGR